LKFSKGTTNSNGMQINFQKGCKLSKAAAIGDIDKVKKLLYEFATCTK
jgi:hypothetical protein